MYTTIFLLYIFTKKAPGFLFHDVGSFSAWLETLMIGWRLLFSSFISQNLDGKNGGDTEAILTDPSTVVLVVDQTIKRVVVWIDRLQGVWMEVG
jgi:hypothetical protein